MKDYLDPLLKRLESIDITVIMSSADPFDLEEDQELEEKP